MRNVIVAFALASSLCAGCTISVTSDLQRFARDEATLDTKANTADVQNAFNVLAKQLGNKQDKAAPVTPAQ